MFEKLEDYKDSKQKAIDACIGRAEQMIEDKFKCIASIMWYSNRYLYYKHDNKKEKYKASEYGEVYKKIGYSASNSESIDLWY